MRERERERGRESERPLAHLLLEGPQAVVQQGHELAPRPLEGREKDE